MEQRNKPLVLLISAVAGLSAIVGASAVSANQQSVPTKVSVAEGTPSAFSLTTSRAVVPAGRVTFEVKNAGSIVHEVAVIRTSRKAAALPGPRTKVSETGMIGESGDVVGHGSRRFTLILSPGHYALICNLTGHYAGGMHADLTVR